MISFIKITSVVRRKKELRSAGKAKKLDEDSVKLSYISIYHTSE